MHTELDFLRQVFSNPVTYNWSLPITHLIKLKPNYEESQDACLMGGGGFSFNLHFWWIVEWPSKIASCTIHFLKKETRFWYQSTCSNMMPSSSVSLLLSFPGKHFQMINVQFIQWFSHGPTTLQQRLGQNASPASKVPKEKHLPESLHTSSCSLMLASMLHTMKAKRTPSPITFPAYANKTISHVFNTIPLSNSCHG